MKTICTLMGMTLLLCNQKIYLLILYEIYKKKIWEFGVLEKK